MRYVSFFFFFLLLLLQHEKLMEWGISFTGDINAVYPRTSLVSGEISEVGSLAAEDSLGC